jgi:hypothetical protein
MATKKKLGTGPHEKPRVLGDLVKICPLADVRPNTWNPNGMTSFMRTSLREGLRKGWIAAQALTIWGSDEKQNPKNFIIDGEHRWSEAKALGYTEGPMVWFFGITEAKAKALTVELNGKHGDEDPAKLSALIRSVHPDFQGDLGLDLGIEKAEMARYLTVPAPLVLPTAEPPDLSSTSMKMKQLYFNEEQHQEFNRLIRDLNKKFKTANITDATMETMRRAHTAANARH